MPKSVSEIEAKAYEIWEAEGRPHGRHHEHWLQAAAEDGTPPAAADDHPEPAAKESHPGMMGDGTEEQNLGQPGNPSARITEDEVQEAFAGKPVK